MSNFSYTIKILITFSIFFVFIKDLDAQNINYAPRIHTDSLIQIRLFSMQAKTTGNHVNLMFSDLFNMNEQMVRENIIGIKAGTSGLGEIVLMGPSIVFPINNKTNISFTTKGKILGNYWNIDGRIVSEINESYHIIKDYPYFISSGEKIKMALAAWDEICIGYYRKILSNQHHEVEAMFQLNLLTGLSHVSTNIYFSSGKVAFDDINAYLTESTGTISTNSSINIPDHPSFRMIFTGKHSISGTSGVSYTYAKNNDKPYTLKTGFYFYDIGKLVFSPDSMYSKSYKITLETDNLYFAENIDKFKIHKISNYLDNTPHAFQQINVSKNNYRVILPARFQFFTDYRFSRNYGLYSDIQLSLTHKNTTHTLWGGNNFCLAPYYKNKNKSVYLLLNHGSYAYFNAGLFLQYKGFSIGSETFFTTLFKPAQQLDIQFGATMALSRSTLHKLD